MTPTPSSPTSPQCDTTAVDGGSLVRLPRRDVVQLCIRDDEEPALADARVCASVHVRCRKPLGAGNHPLRRGVARRSGGPSSTAASVRCRDSRACSGDRRRLEGTRSMVTVSLCVCTRDRPADLERCLASVAAGSELPQAVIVSDDGKLSADTRTIVSSLGEPFVYVAGPRKGLSANRNNCIRFVTTSHVAFTDDDVVVPRRLRLLAGHGCGSCRGRDRHRLGAKAARRQGLRANHAPRCRLLGVAAQDGARLTSIDRHQRHRLSARSLRPHPVRRATPVRLGGDRHCSTCGGHRHRNTVRRGALGRPSAVAARQGLHMSPWRMRRASTRT